MQKQDCYYLGKILKPYGNKGHLQIILETDDPSRYIKLKQCFLEINDSLIPFFIEEITLLGGTAAAVKFLDLDDPGRAEAFRNITVYLPLADLPSLKGKQFYLHEISGFKVIDQEKGEIGIIAGILEYPMQYIFRISYHDKEILIPVHDDILKKVDRKNKTISIVAPAGLIDLYLE
ncbi:MAG: 16S rRNA processing protein RimM [Bacteroidetes bacterium]|nr:16S rRNA processing protein RimM [Bacteroidota bacterium]